MTWRQRGQSGAPERAGTSVVSAAFAGHVANIAMRGNGAWMS